MNVFSILVLSLEIVFQILLDACRILGFKELLEKI